MAAVTNFKQPYSLDLLVRQSIGPTVHRSDFPLVRQFVGPTVRQSIGPTDLLDSSTMNGNSDKP